MRHTDNGTSAGVVFPPGISGNRPDRRPDGASIGSITIYSRRSADRPFGDQGVTQASGGRLALVTGGTGLLGSHIAERLAARGDRVRALVRRSSYSIYTQF